MIESRLLYLLKPDDQLCFIRIPKTASTTLVSLLKPKFPSHASCRYSETEVASLSQDELKQYRLFVGHIGYGIHQVLSKKPIYITVVRNPVDRVISLYKHCRDSIEPTSMAELLRNAASQGLNAFINNPDPAVRIRIENLQTRQMAIGLGREYEELRLDYPYRDEAVLNLAKAHLDECKFVGTTERFQDSLLLLNYVFGWNPIVEYQNRRVRPDAKEKEKPDPEILHQILQMNQLDQALWQYSQQLFETSFRIMQQELETHYGNGILDPERSEFKINEPFVPDQSFINQLEKHYANCYQTQYPEPLKSIHFTPEQVMSGSGWQKRKWIGPKPEATLDFPLEPHQTYRIRLYINKAAAPDILDSLALIVNDSAVALTPLIRRDNSALLEGTIPQAALDTDQPYTRFTFRVNRTEAVAGIASYKSHDTLWVGVALHQLEIFQEGDRPPSHHGEFLFFREQQSVWRETADFIDQHLHPDEYLTAPPEFIERFSAQWVPFDASSTKVSWAIVHKGWMDQLDTITLKSVVRSMTPVLANSVFVVFSNRSDLPAIPASSEHFQSFQQDYRRITGEKSWLERVPFLKGGFAK